MIDVSPLVSIAIPTYNHGRYLPAAIESVLAQDYPHVELIVLDDGSTDNTSELLSQYEAGLFRWESQSNRGQSQTLNTAWEQASGELLGYLAADDILLPGAIRHSVDALQNRQEAVGTYGDSYLVSPAGNRLRHVAAPPFDLFELVRNAGDAGILTPAMIFRRWAIEAVGGWSSEFRREPDVDFILRLSLLGPLVPISHTLANYRIHPGSISCVKCSVAEADEPIQIIEQFWQSPNIPADLRQYELHSRAAAYLRSAQWHCRARRLHLAAERFRQACALRPTYLFAPHSYHRLLHGTLHATIYRFWTSTRDWVGNRAA